MMSVIVGSQSEYPPSDTHRPDVGEHRVGFYFNHIGEITDMVEGYYLWVLHHASLSKSIPAARQSEAAR